MTRFGAALRAEMEARGWSARELAMRSATPVNTVKGWLRGQVPRQRGMERLCSALGLRYGALGEPSRAPEPNVSGEPATRRQEVARAVRAGEGADAIAARLGMTSKAVERLARQAKARPRPVTPAPKEPVAAWERALMAAPSQMQPWCAVCGATGPLERHHVVYRSQGGTDGPVVTLCRACHMACHAHTLHLRFVRTPAVAHSLAYGQGGHWEWMRTERPLGEFAALGTEDGWHAIRRRSDER